MPTLFRSFSLVGLITHVLTAYKICQDQVKCIVWFFLAQIARVQPISLKAHKERPHKTENRYGKEEKLDNNQSKNLNEEKIIKIKRF